MFKQLKVYSAVVVFSMMVGGVYSGTIDNKINEAELASVLLAEIAMQDTAEVKSIEEIFSACLENTGSYCGTVYKTCINNSGCGFLTDQCSKSEYCLAVLDFIVQNPELIATGLVGVATCVYLYKWVTTGKKGLSLTEADKSLFREIGFTRENIANFLQNNKSINIQNLTPEQKELLQQKSTTGEALNKVVEQNIMKEKRGRSSSVVNEGDGSGSEGDTVINA